MSVPASNQFAPLSFPLVRGRPAWGRVPRRCDRRLSFPLVRGRPAWEVAYLYPEQGYWEESDYLSIGTNHMIEFDNGFIEVLPMPTFLHQLIVRFLFKALEGYVAVHATGEVLFAPLAVRLWSAKYREPEISLPHTRRVRLRYRRDLRAFPRLQHLP